MSVSELITNQDHPWADLRINSITFTGGIPLFENGTFDVTVVPRPPMTTVPTSTVTTIQYYRIGKMVMLIFPTLTTLFATGNGDISVVANSIPINLRPIVDVNFSYTVNQAGTQENIPGKCLISSNGGIIFYYTWAQDAWTYITPRNIQYRQFNASYYTA